ncbi:MAG: hypothetical protein E7527_02300 [Ruminococcaceae bacterium]|nr:hypothetical protein [Oscillospiraceae bacterium]
MGNNRHGHHHREPREAYLFGEHDIGNHHYRFKYDGKVYTITEQVIIPEKETEEKVLLEETDSRAAYEAWNHIKRPERFGGIVVLPQPKNAGENE